MVPRYYVFIMEKCYPEGGMNDLAGVYDDIQDALDHAMSRNRQAYDTPNVYVSDAHVMDRDSMKTILELEWDTYEDWLPSINLMLFDEAEEAIFRRKYASCFEEGAA